MELQTVAFVVGIIFGAIAVGSAAHVWVRHRQFGSGGTTLTIFGVVLIGLPVWSAISIEISREGLKAEFERLEQQVRTVAEANQAIVEETEHLAQLAETQRQQLLQLVEPSNDPAGVMDPRRRDEIRDSLSAAPQVDVERLKAVSGRLQQLREESAETPKSTGEAP